MPDWTSPFDARAAVCFVTCIGLAIASLEWLIPVRKLSGNSLVSAVTFGTSSTNALRDGLVIRTLFALRFAGSFAFIILVWFSIQYTWIAIAAVLTALFCLPIRMAKPIGLTGVLNGAEHVLTANLVALAPTYLLGSHLAVETALAFVAFRTLAEYVSAGWTKVGDWRRWIDGTNLCRVFESSNYGYLPLARLLRVYPKFAGIVSTAIISIEILVPLVLVIPSPLAELLLLAAFSFHIGTAVIMGLNTFVWAFLATYPAILHCRLLLLSYVTIF